MRNFRKLAQNAFTSEKEETSLSLSLCYEIFNRLLSAERGQENCIKYIWCARRSPMTTLCYADLFNRGELHFKLFFMQSSSTE